MKKKNLTFIYFTVSIIVIFTLVIFLTFDNNKKISENFNEIKFQLITSTHTSLPWEFKPINESIKIKIGEVVNIEYFVKNLSNQTTSGIASFAYYPKELDAYIIKIQCFCYDVKTLNAGEENKYTLTMMIDPAVTKDSKTKVIKEAIMQFTFFDSKEFRENKS